ncbi:hypothetical protein V2J09_023624 [Rumex salicifolius]
MNCLPCFKGDEESDSSRNSKNQTPASNQSPDSANVKTFSFRELAMATKNFRQECLLGEGGFGRVFRGMIQASGQVVAVKQLDRNGMQGNKEFMNEAVKLSLLNHANLVNLIGYCADGDQRVLVYEYVPEGSLEQHLFGGDPEMKPLDWSTRMNIASGAAQALEYLHEKANPPVIYGDFKSSNVLLSEKFEPKLSDVGLSKFGGGDGMNEQGSRMMATYGYSAPEYSKGEVTLKSDIYSFGVVLLELITGRRAIDTSRPTDEQNLVTWAQPYFRDPKRFSEMSDPKLNKQFPATSLNQAVGIAAMCIQDEPMVRPLISDVTSVLSCISMIPNIPSQPQTMEYEKEMQHKNQKQKDKHSSKSDSSSSSSDSEDTKSRDHQSGEYHDSDDDSSEHEQTGQVSDGESGSDYESEDESDEESTLNSDDGASDDENESPSSGKPNRTKTKRVESRQQSSNKPKMKGVPSANSSGSSRQTVVTFKEPSKKSKYSPGGKSKSSSSENSSESDEGGSSSHQEKYSTDYSDATENGLGSSHHGFESDSSDKFEKRIMVLSSSRGNTRFSYRDPLYIQKSYGYKNIYRTIGVIIFTHEVKEQEQRIFG